MKRAYYDLKPLALEPVGNGNYLYRWDMKEEYMASFMDGVENRLQYSCCEATITGNPTYDKCVEAVIRHEYPTVEKEIAIINKYNSYINGVISDGSIIEEYNKYLKYISDVKMMVKNDLKY